MISAFVELYETIFDANGFLTNCGRSETIKLIELADKIEKDVSHGSLVTGFMDVESIQTLYNKIK